MGYKDPQGLRKAGVVQLFASTLHAAGTSPITATAYDLSGYDIVGGRVAIHASMIKNATGLGSIIIQGALLKTTGFVKVAALTNDATTTAKYCTIINLTGTTKGSKKWYRIKATNFASSWRIWVRAMAQV